MNRLYDNGRQAISDGVSIAWASDTIRAVLINLSLYTPNFATDANLSDVPAGACAAISGALIGKTNVAGLFNCLPFAFVSVAAGPACGAIAIYKDTGDPTTSKLIAYLDTAVGLPVTPAGDDVVCSPDTGANKLFKV